MKMPLGPPTSRNLYQYHGESVKRNFRIENDNVVSRRQLKKWAGIPMECIELAAWTESVEKNGWKCGETEGRRVKTSSWRAP